MFHIEVFTLYCEKLHPTTFKINKVFIEKFPLFSYFAYHEIFSIFLEGSRHFFQVLGESWFFFTSAIKSTFTKFLLMEILLTIHEHGNCEHVWIYRGFQYHLNINLHTLSLISTIFAFRWSMKWCSFHKVYIHDY